MTNIDDTRSLRMALTVAVLASAGLMAIYYGGGVAGHADSTPIRAAIVGSAGAVVAGLLAWWFARGAYSGDGGRLAGRTALFGVVAAASLAGFWIGITVPVCVAAVALGLKAVAAGRPVRGYATAGVGVVALFASTILCVLGAS